MKHLLFLLTLFLAWKTSTTYSFARASENENEGTKDDAHDNDGDEPTTGTTATPPQQQQGPKITPTSWVLSATTHMPKQLSHALAKDLSKQANYIHWTCYRQQTVQSQSLAKLECCREIYQLQERDPFHLCWRKKSCLRDKVGRSDFMHYCTQQIVSLDLLDGELDQSIPPRFSLLVAPQLDDLVSDKWRQFVSFDSTQGGHWVYMIESPLRLAMDPQSFFASPEPENDKQQEESSTTNGVFGARISSRVLADPDDDEDFRDFAQVLVVELPMAQDENDMDHLWAVSLRVVLYLPEAAGLRKNSLPKCQASAGTCQLENKQDSKDSVDQQSLVQTSILLSDVPATSNTVTVEWTYSIALDDDNILLPGPFIFSGSATQSGGGETAKLKWKASAMDKIAFPTSLDEHDEL